MDILPLPADRCFNVLTHMYLKDASVEKEYAEARDKNRAAILKAYNINNTDVESQYGSSNDEAGEEVELDPFGEPINPRVPLPELPVTEQDEAGYRGLDPPVGFID